MQHMLEALEKAKAAPGIITGELCRCGKFVTFKPALGGHSIDMLHPQPACHEFRALCDALVQHDVAAPLDAAP